MDEIFARSDLIKGERLRELGTKSDGAGVIQAGSHVGAMMATGIALSQTWGSWWAVPVFMLHGTLLNYLYAGQHELSHWTVFKTRRYNEWLGRAFGFILIYPRTFDQIQHFAHHRFTQDWARDGELARPAYTLRSYLLWVLGPTYWQVRLRRIVRYSRGIVSEPYIPDNRKAELIREARLHLAGYLSIAAVSLASGSPAALVYWIAPMFAMKVTHQLMDTMEHLGLTHASNVLINTRSIRTNALMRWMAWQMPYHTAHHAFPGVPFHRLKELHREIFDKNGLAPHSMTYLGFQRAVLRAFANGRTEADYPNDVTWIKDAADRVADGIPAGA
jgi:fatty acid desaturase